MVGIPDQKSGILPFSIAPIEFRLPEPLPELPDPAGQWKDSIDEALMRARSWREELASDSFLKRADIARREGLARARVTQLLTLNRIPPQAIQQIRQNTVAGKRPVSIRVLLRLTDGHGHRPSSDT